eukprot:m.1021570 g.1021570  ORF g.1021570 m.1021570 type:complete len:206 (-) comp24095_c0_seq18:2601-3218(-)
MYKSKTLNTVLCAHSCSRMLNMTRIEDGAPFGFGNDGLLDIRLLTSTNGVNITYAAATNARSPFVPLGTNLCGPNAASPSIKSGWCSPTSGIESSTSFDTSAQYMADGYVPSTDGTLLYLYSSGQPFTHGGDAGKHSWGNNTGVRLLSLRRDGFAYVDSPYTFNTPREQLPAIIVSDITVPSACANGSGHDVYQTSFGQRLLDGC